MVTMQIWTNRLLKELDGIDSRLPAGISLSSHDMEPESGVCKAFFEAALKAAAASGGGSKEEEGSSRGENQEEEEEEKEDSGGKKSAAAGDSNPADSASPPTPAEGKIDGEHLPPPPPPPADEDGSEGEGGGSAGSAEAAPELLRFKIEMDLGLDTRYPFECPVIRVLEGDDVMPTSILSGDGLLSLPGSDAWTPSSTIVNTLQDISDMVLHAKEAGLPTGQGGDDAGALERGELRPGALVGTEALSGCLFPCTPPAAPLFSSSVLAPGSRRPLDRYVGVTDRQLLELEAHRTRMNKTVVVLAIPLSSLKKLKFRRGASVTVILKTDEAKEFLTPQSYECVKAVTERLEKMGIAGHQTTAGAERQVDHASSLMAALGRKEAQFGIRERPDLTLVEECMDLFRQAAELYSAADDPRHEEVLAHMHRFLQREDVLSALGGDGSPDGGASSSSDSTPVEGAAPVHGAPAAEKGSGGGDVGGGGSPEGSGADGSRAVADLVGGGGGDDQASAATTGSTQEEEAAAEAEGAGSTPTKTGTAAAAAAAARRTAGTPVSAAAAAKRTPSSRTSPSTATSAAGRGGGARRTSSGGGGGRTEAAGGSGGAAGRGGRASPSSAASGGGAGKTAGLSGRSTTGRYGSGSRKDPAASNASPSAKKSGSSASPSTDGGAGGSGGRGKTRGGGRGGRGTRGRGAGASGAKAASGTSS